MTRPTHTHWLRGNASVRSPWRVLVFDTETINLDRADPERQTLRLWCARLVRRHGIDPKLPRHEDFRGLTAGELAELIDRTARRDRTLWLFAHNLSFDLAVTALPVELAARGWRLTEGALTSDSPWCRMTRGDARLTVADTWSWLPASVEAIGELIGRRKTPLPAGDASMAEWWARCERDTEITAAAIVELMDWWDAGELGAWSVTGPACGWSSYRHRRPGPRVLVDPDPAARALEARAVTGGRREVRRTGDLGRGLYADLDLATAHLTVMAGRPLPARRFAAFESLPLDSDYLHSGILDVLAEAEVETAAPRYPWSAGRGVFYPVGRFRTVLAGPELREALRRGELRSIGAGYVYHVRAHMAGWALWLAELLDEATPGIPATVRLLAKHWSRCVPGKWAGRSSEVVSKIPDPRPGWAVERGAIDGGRRPADFLRLGGELWTIARDEWADDAFPAILAWIQSYTRVAVSRLLDRLGPAVVSCNTDGVLVDVMRWWTDLAAVTGERRPHQAAVLAALDLWCQDTDAELAPFSVRIKGAWAEAEVFGPQHLILSGERRLAGIPRRAHVLADGRYAFTAWPKLRIQLIPDGPAGYSTEQRTVKLDAIPPTGWLGYTGTVSPITVRPGEHGDTIAPPGLPETARLGALAPRERQHPALRAVMP